MNDSQAQSELTEPDFLKLTGIWSTNPYRKSVSRQQLQEADGFLLWAEIVLRFKWLRTRRTFLSDSVLEMLAGRELVQFHEPSVRWPLWNQRCDVRCSEVVYIV